MRFDLFLIIYKSNNLRLSKINHVIGFNTGTVLKFMTLNSLFSFIENKSRSYPLHLIFTPSGTYRLKDYTRKQLETDWRILFLVNIDTQLEINFTEWKK
jgi:hypothetical protein